MSSVHPLPIDRKNNQSEDETCFHCGLSLPNKLNFSHEIDGEQRRFCCPACQTVCKSIYNAGLQGFYERTPENGLLAPPPETPEDLSLYDLDEVQSEFVPDLANNREIHLLVEGIHCAACVWLIERHLGQQAGILSVHVNLSGKRLNVRWCNEKIGLSQIIQQMAEIGYGAVPYDPQVAEGRIKKQNQALLFRMAFAGFAMMNLLWISIALYSGADTGEYRSLFHWVGFVLATPTLFYSGYPFLRSAWTGLRRFHLTMDLPIAIGAVTTYFYSVYITLSQSSVGEVYYDTLVNFMFVILVGRYLEAMSKRQAVSSTQRLLDLQPRGACIVREGIEQLLPIRAVKADDHVMVKPGNRIPVDGVVLEGRSNVDESMLSGESASVKKAVGDKVSAGTYNVDSVLIIKVESVLKDTVLGRIIHLVEEAQASKAPIQCVADRIVPWFVAVTLCLATLTFVWWVGVDFELALMAATAVLIITCPCAFGLATPMAIASASGLGARYGILIKNGEVLETLSGINHFVFDKTGTLTHGHMTVKEVFSPGDYSENELLRFVAALENYSEHRIANAVLIESHNRTLNIPGASEVENKPGRGVKGAVESNRVLVGTKSWLVENNIAINSQIKLQAQHWETQGITCVHVAINDNHIGLIAIADQLRADAKALVEALREDGKRITLLSGDRQQVANEIANQLGGMDVIAEVLPEDKDNAIQKLQRHGEKVAMIGDGVNDAPALVRADVGIALGSGTDVSGESADIILMTDELSKVRLTSKLSQRTLRTIHQNIVISFTYNIIMVPLAMATYITPLVAAVSMPISSLLVIGNAARIRTLFKKERNEWM